MAELTEAGARAPTLLPGVHVVARTATDVEALQIMRADAVRHGLVAETVAPRDVPGYRPDRSMAAVDALYLADEATVDTGRLLVSVQHIVRRTGADVRTARVQRLELSSSGVTAVTSDGPVTADQVVLATGAETTALLRASNLDGLLPPVLGGRGVSVLVRASHTVPMCVRTPNRAFGCGLHLVPREGGHIYIGATNRLTTRVEPESTAQLAELSSLLGGATSELDVGLRKAELVQTCVGYRPVTLDRRPLVGRTNEEAVLIATATWRNGVVLAPVVADLIVGEISPGLDPRPPFLADPRRDSCRPGSGRATPRGRGHRRRDLRERVDRAVALVRVVGLPGGGHGRVGLRPRRRPGPRCGSTARPGAARGGSADPARDDGSEPRVTCGPRLLEMLRDPDRREPTGLDDTWRDLGVDSLDLLVLVTNVEDEFGVALSDATVAGVATVGDLAAAVDRLLARAIDCFQQPAEGQEVR